MFQAPKWPRSQAKIAILGLGDVERAFVHVDYESEHDINMEHKPLYDTAKKEKRTLRQMLLGGKKKIEPEPEPEQTS